MFRLVKFTPPHGWRSVAWELAIVTMGVLIALAAQEWAGDQSSKRRVRAAETAMVLEIENSLLASAELRRLDGCWDVQLRGLEEAIVNGDDPAAARIVRAGSIAGHSCLWADNGLQAALSAPVGEHLGSEKLKRYSQVYGMIRQNRIAQAERERAFSLLEPLLIAGRPISAEITHSLLTAVAELRASKTAMHGAGQLIADYAKQDLKLEVGERQYLQARGRIENLQLCEKEARALL